MLTLPVLLINAYREVSEVFSLCDSYQAKIWIFLRGGAPVRNGVTNTNKPLFLQNTSLVESRRSSQGGVSVPFTLPPRSAPAQVIRSFPVCEKFPSLLKLLVFFFPDIFRSCDCKFVFRLILNTCKMSLKCGMKEKRTVTKDKSLLVRGLETSFPQKNL